MKFLLGFIFVASAFAQGNYIDATGTVVTRQKEYITVVNSASGALTVGEAVCLDLTADDGISVDFCASSGFKPLCVITDTSCAVGKRCLCQTKGFFENLVLDVTQGNAVAGGAAFAHTDGSTYGDTTDENKHPIGVFLDAASASGTIQAYIQL